MTKKIILSLAIASAMFAEEEAKKEEPKKEAKSIEEAFKLADIKGQIRALYQSNSKLNDEKTADTLLGGKLSIETASLYGISIGGTFYTANKMSSKQNAKDADYYNNENGYTMLGESFVRYSFKNGEIKLGRMELDTPLVNSDDIRMIPDLYTAAVLTYSPLERLNITAGVVTQMAGWENGGERARFIKIGEVIESATADDGGVWNKFFADNSSARESKLYILGATYEYNMLTAQAWYAKQSDIIDTYYVEGAVKPIDSEKIGLSLIAQYMKELSTGKLKNYSDKTGNEATRIDSNIYGLAIEVASKQIGVSANFAYNKSDKKNERYANGGTAYFFGGGKDPLLTSMDVETANKEGDIKAYKGKVGLDFEKLGFDGLSTALAHAYFDKKASNSYSKETDFTIAYGYKNVNIEAMLTNIKIKDSVDNNRVRLYVKYDF